MMGPIELLIVLLLLFGVIALIKHGNAAFIGTVLFGLAIVPLFLLGMCLVGMWVGISQSVTEVPPVVHKAIDGVEQVSDNPTDTLSNREKELDEFTKPQIDLGEETPSPQEKTKSEEKSEPVEESKTDPELELKSGEPLPAWVTDPPESEEGVWQRVVATEPCFTADSLARAKANLFMKTISEYLSKQVDSEIPLGFFSRVKTSDDFFVRVFEQHTENRETSVGNASISHMLLTIAPSDNEWLVQQWSEWKAEERLAGRGMRVAGIGLLSGAVLCVLGILYGLLRMGGK